MSLTDAKITVSVKGTITNSTNALAPISVPLNFNKTFSFAAGTGASQADRCYATRVALSTSPTDLDLSGILEDPAGNSIVFAEIVSIMVYNRSEVAGEIVTVGGSSNDFVAWVKATGDGVKVKPGGLELIVDPNADAYAVTNSTADLLRLVAATGTPSVDIIVLGKSAA